MKVDVVIPTRKRKEKLVNCLESLMIAKRNYDIDIYIYFNSQEDLNNFPVKFSKYVNKWLFLRLEPEYRVPTFWNKYLRECRADAMCYLNDDVLVKEDIFKQIIKAFVIHFPDFDGVIGLNQKNIIDLQKVESAFGVIGIKYANRFPNKEIFCLDYYRFFADFELWQYAKSINKFVFCKEAQLVHLHPAFYKDLEDETHKEVRKYLSLDKKTFRQRQLNNLIWGQTFETLNGRK